MMMGLKEMAAYGNLNILVITICDHINNYNL